MTETKPMATSAEKASAEAQRQYDDVVKQMTDHRIYDRVMAFHPHANTGPDALKAMVDDYNRLKAEQDAAKAETSKPA